MDHHVQPKNTRNLNLFYSLLFLSFSWFLTNYLYFNPYDAYTAHIPIEADDILAKCRSLNDKPGPPPNFHLRRVSDRFAPGTPPTLIRNAKIWTGNEAGREVVNGDLLMDGGIIQAVGNIAQFPDLPNLRIINANGSWITPGIVDMHSHMGVASLPILAGSYDVESHNGIIQPWLRSVDGLNTHDLSYNLSTAGGVTTALILPGSESAIGGQAFTIKLRKTRERSASAMLLEPPESLLGLGGYRRWRQMKQACGENPSQAYAGTRMDTAWALRSGYETARKLKVQQDEYCEKARRGRQGLGDFPESLQWEMLVDALRGRVKVHNHCYEPVDLDAIVRLSNEFKFSIAAFHHAHSAYLVPDLLKKTYGHPPALALYPVVGRYKREAYRASDYEPRILHDNGFDVVFKSDHPLLNSRYLPHIAQVASYYSLPSHVALSALTSTPSRILGLDHRIGHLKKGWDADVVLWDSHPLALGATPRQVWSDGIAQIPTSESGGLAGQRKPDAFQHIPKTPNWDKEINETLEWDGLPPLESDGATKESGEVIFDNVSSIWVRGPDGKSVRQLFPVAGSVEAGQRRNVTVVMKGGRLHSICLDVCTLHDPSADPVDWKRGGLRRIDLEGGSISPALITYGSPLGLTHISSEPSTSDGLIPDVLASPRSPSFLGEPPTVIHAVDGLLFGSRDALLAYRSGVSCAVVSPVHQGIFSGISTYFSTSSPHALAPGALLQLEGALHFAVLRDAACVGGLPCRRAGSISTQIAALRALLIRPREKVWESKDGVDTFLQRVVKGAVPLVIQVESADSMAALIRLKKEIEAYYNVKIRVTFVGALESHLIAKAIAEADIGIIITQPRPVPLTWESQRIMPGPPLSNETLVSVLLQHNIRVGLGTVEKSLARHLRFDMAWAALDIPDLTRAKALSLASVNLETLLGVEAPDDEFGGDLVVTRGGTIFDFEGKVVGVASSQRGIVDMFE